MIQQPIYHLQTMLRQISEIDTRVLPVIPDGYYGSNTYASIRSFQSAYGLTETGTTDQETWRTVTAVYHDLRPQYLPVTITPASSVRQQLNPGEENLHLHLVQGMLAALRRIFPDLPSPELTGTLDEQTAEGLRWVQRAANLPETGALDTPTWSNLNNLYRTAVGDGRI